MDWGWGLEALAEDGDPSGLAGELADRTGLTSPLAPGVYAIFESGTPLFVDGEADSGMGLEALAEDGNPAGLAGALGADEMVLASGAFAVPVGGMDPAPAFPGEAYEFTFEATSGARLSLATMLVQTNDLFYAPAADGIALFDGDDMPIGGDITGSFMLWDAGTESNQEPGVGSDQAPRQAGADTGEDEMGNVMLVDDGYTYPAVSDVLKVTIAVQ
jgi:hypothetical protein